MGKNILLINDLTGYGTESLTAMMPVLAKQGFNTYNLPTAIVSNTFDYGKFSILDTTDYMKNTLKVWEELGFSFDCICTGLVVSDEQVKLISDYILDQARKDIIVMVDPIMGDEQKLYNGITEATVKQMRKLCALADYIVPNMTEACFLSNKYIGQVSWSQKQCTDVIDSLRQLKAKSVVITSADIEGQSVVCGYDHLSEKYFKFPFKTVPVKFSGTGDIFSAIMIGSVLQGNDLSYSVVTAMKNVEKLIKLNFDIEDKLKGIAVDKYLKVMEI
ncbi:MAG TPA: pyridoxamine kinase [Clostridiales bacterium]|nr:pyridoxamine kinase [Clostridiales bacterium]